MILKEKIALASLVVVYLLTTPLDYQPDASGSTLFWAVLTNMVDVATIAVGLTLMIVGVMRIVIGVPMSRHRVFRYFFTFAILVNLYYYTSEIMK